MTEITVTATKEVVGVYVELQHATPHNVQGTLGTLLTTPDEMQNVVIETTGTRRDLADTSPEVQAAVETLVAAVLVWHEEDNPTEPPA